MFPTDVMARRAMASLFQKVAGHAWSERSHHTIDMRLSRVEFSRLAPADDFELDDRLGGLLNVDLDERI